MNEMLNIALPKGRLGEAAYALLESLGYDCSSIKEGGRKLIFENVARGVRYFWVKPSDVSVYVAHGAADIGVVGKDILLEDGSDVYELYDLGFGKCRMAVAAQKGFKDDTSRALRVATKFPNIAKQFYSKKSRDIELIRLNGSIELAPILGLSDVIVDLVETGRTLAENDLEVIETIVHISARLIANKAAFKFKNSQINSLLSRLENKK
jgi:ATP phosphoribosyltransferase